MSFSLRSPSWLASSLVLGLFACAPRPALPVPQVPLVATSEVEVLRELPASTPDENGSVPDIRAFTLANGMKLYVLESHAFPHVAASFVSLNGGESERDLEHAGLSSLITEALLASAETRTTSQHGEPASSLPRIEFGGRTLRHTAVFSTMLQSENLGEGLRAMAQLVRAPSLDDASLSLARKRARAAWEYERYGVSGVARNHIAQRLYGPEHVLGQHAEMATKRLDGHPLEAVREGYARRYLPGASAVVLVGDLDPNTAKDLTMRYFADWAADGKAPVSYQPSDWRPRGKRKIFLHSRGAVACIVLGQRAPGPSEQDYVATEVLAHLIGGSFSSRLMTRLRVQSGLAYSASSRLAPRRDGSLLTIETYVERDTAERALALISYELKGLQNHLIGDEELRRVANSLRQRELARYETTSSASAAIQASLELDQDPASHSQKYLDTLGALSAVELRATARRVLDLRAPVVIVGDLAMYGDLGQWADDDDEQL